MEVEIPQQLLQIQVQAVRQEQVVDQVIVVDQDQAQVVAQAPEVDQDQAQVVAQAPEVDQDQAQVVAQEHIYHNQKQKVLQMVLFKKVDVMLEVDHILEATGTLLYMMHKVML